MGAVTPLEPGARWRPPAPTDAAPPAGPPARDPPAVLAVLDVLDRDGHPRQTHRVHAWPLRIGRALDNDVVLADPHVAPHHVRLDADGAGDAPADGAGVGVGVGTGDTPPGTARLEVGDTRNGVALGRRRLAAGEHAVLADRGEGVELTLGRTVLRLRLPGHALAAELALAPAGSALRRVALPAAAALVVVGGVLFTTYLATDPEALARSAGSALLGAAVAGAVWCIVWALLSKTFTRQAHFGWHVRVFLYASVALLVVTTLPALFAFAFSWPWLTDFDFIGPIGVIAAALYYHLLAVEPGRHRVLKGVAVTCAAVGVLLSLWFNVQRTDQLGNELYMSHLFPPALRLAAPIPVDAFVDGLATLRPTLERKAREPGRGDDAARPEED